MATYFSFATTGFFGGGEVGPAISWNGPDGTLDLTLCSWDAANVMPPAAQLTILFWNFGTPILSAVFAIGSAVPTLSIINALIKGPNMSLYWTAPAIADTNFQNMSITLGMR